MEQANIRNTTYFEAQELSKIKERNSRKVLAILLPGSEVSRKGSSTKLLPTLQFLKNAKEELLRNNF